MATCKVGLCDGSGVRWDVPNGDGTVWICMECECSPQIYVECSACGVGTKITKEVQAAVQEAVAARNDEDHRRVFEIASSLAEFERVESVGMASATLPEKIDALLRELARLRRQERCRTGAWAPADKLSEGVVESKEKP